MEDEKSILDSVYKVCSCCQQRKTLRNFNKLIKPEIEGNDSIANLFSHVCKCCERNPKQRLKSNRIDAIREKVKHFRENEKKRLDKEKTLALEGELLED